jgi:hypothetical protein
MLINTLMALVLLIPNTEIIDRILAVVENSIVTQSDLVAAERLGLEKAPRGAADPVAGVLDKLIERRLMLIEVDRYAPPEPPPANIELRFEQVRLSFPSTAAFQAVLKDTGLDEAQLRRRLRDDLRIDAYLQQRFGMVVQPTEQQILEYYQAHPAEFTTNGALRPYNDVHEDVRQALATERRSRAIRDWLANLRRRANVNVLYAARS